MSEQVRACNLSHKPHVTYGIVILQQKASFQGSAARSQAVLSEVCHKHILKVYSLQMNTNTYTGRVILADSHIRFVFISMSSYFISFSALCARRKDQRQFHGQEANFVSIAGVEIHKTESEL